MSTEFEEEVRNREHHTRWTSVSSPWFMKDMALANPNYDVMLTVRCRNPSENKYEYALSWYDAAGHEHAVSASTPGKLMWRAATLQMKIEPEKKEAKYES